MPLNSVAGHSYLLVGLPLTITQLLDVDRELDVIADSVPAQLLMLTQQVMSHVSQQQYTSLVESPLGNLCTEGFIACAGLTAS